jgi:hydroxymethylglutaryl-CoA synthase
MKVGIIGYGAYIPQGRISVETIATAWNKEASSIKSNLGITEKSVANHDEDAATMAVEASKNTLSRSNISPSMIEAVYVGSESHPYAVKPTATMVGDAIGLSENYTAADMEFACKAGTAALQAACGMVESNIAHYALAIGTDTAQAKPGDILEYSAAAGGAAFIVGKNNKDALAIIEETLSHSSDTPDFWRRNLEPYPEHGNRFTGLPSYFHHVIATIQKMEQKSCIKIKDFDHVILHQPNSKFPLAVSKQLGISKEQLHHGLLAPFIGNTYSACSPLGLTAVLDNAKSDQKILLVSYGSGSGCDAFVIRTTEMLQKKQNVAPSTSSYIEKKEYLSYEQYKRRTS